MSCELEKAFAMIRAQLKQSQVPEDPGHAENTLKWLLRLDPQADLALRLAALAHDIERASPSRLRRQDFYDYDRFKAMHAAIGARMAASLFRGAGVHRSVRREACRLIRLHESGGDRSEEHTSELQSRENLVCRLLLEKKNIKILNLN